MTPTDGKKQDLRNEDLSLRPKRSVGKHKSEADTLRGKRSYAVGFTQDFCDYVAVVRPFRTCYANVMTQ